MLLVGRSKSGQTVATENARGTSRRTACVTPSSLIAAAVTEPSTAGRDVVGMALDAGGLVEQAVLVPAESEHAVGEHHASHERGGARSETLAHRDLVLDGQVHRRQVAAMHAGDPPRGLEDEVVRGGRNRAPRRAPRRARGSPRNGGKRQVR